VLTLSEAAAHLRTKEKSLAEMAVAGTVPAREVGGEWRFSRRALEDWLRFPGLHPSEYWPHHPRWLFEGPFLEEFLMMLDKRMQWHLQQSRPNELSPKPGSKQAVQKRFGIFRDDPTLQQMVDDIYARRQTGSAQGEE
jgi:excisionase family DNA binding protein